MNMTMAGRKYDGIVEDTGRGGSGETRRFLTHCFGRACLKRAEVIQQPPRVPPRWLRR
jgi:hypothetical protein